MSKQPYFNAERYVQFRPDYPTALFNDIYKQVDSFELAWDCGCGNGQTALALAKKFNKVIAADISAAQIAKANPQNNIEYHVESYDTTKIKYNSINLLTVSQAMHWFEPDAFYANVQRVLVPAGTLAIWGYDHPRISTDIDAVMDTLYADILSGYWAPSRRHIDEHYANLPFPYEKIPTNEHSITKEWTLEQLIGYLNSWSAVHAYTKKNK